MNVQIKSYSVMILNGISQISLLSVQNDEGQSMQCEMLFYTDSEQVRPISSEMKNDVLYCKTWLPISQFQGTLEVLQGDTPVYFIHDQSGVDVRLLTQKIVPSWAETEAPTRG